MKIYTKTGDDGSTSLFGGKRVQKFNRRIEAYGTVDELNAALGAARAEIDNEHELSNILKELQIELFVLGAGLATPFEARAKVEVPQIREDDVRWLEEVIDGFESILTPLRRFILPGGTRLSAQLHIARTIARRAERLLVALASEEAIGGQDVIFMNRLSDLLFVLARVANRIENVPDIEWDGKRRNG